MISKAPHKRLNSQQLSGTNDFKKKIKLDAAEDEKEEGEVDEALTTTKDDNEEDKEIEPVLQSIARSGWKGLENIDNIIIL